jgi:hypothetical protein
VGGRSYLQGAPSLFDGAVLGGEQLELGLQPLPLLHQLGQELAVPGAVEKEKMKEREEKREGESVLGKRNVGGKRDPWMGRSQSLT